MRTKRKKQSSLFKKLFYGGLFFCLLIGSAYLFVFSSVFWIEEIKVEINDDYLRTILEEPRLIAVIQKVLEEKFFSLIPQKSIFLISSERIKNELLEEFPEIKSVIIYKELPSILGVKIIEREPVGVYCQKERCFYLDKEGIIYRESPLMEGGLILIINDETKDYFVRLKEQVISSEVISFISAVKKELPEFLETDKRENSFGLLPVSFHLSSIEDLKVVVSEGWQIYFNLNQSVQKQLTALKRVLEEEIKEKRINLEYIDLRIENRVYYK